MKVVEVFADVRCPFAHVGIRRLVERGGPDVILRVRAWPLELVNQAPLDGSLIAEEVEELRAQVAPELFFGFDPAHWPSSSLPALGLVAAAYARHLWLGQRVSLAVRDALFEHGRDIAQPEELDEIARREGVPWPVDAGPAVIEDWEEGRRRDVIGSPHFFVDGRGFFCPALDIRRHDGHLVISADHEGLEEMLGV